MHPAVETMPTPIGDIDTLLSFGDSTETPRKVFIGYNLGYKTFLLHMPMHDFYKHSEVANEPGDSDVIVAQRPLDIKHAQKLAVYILKGLLNSAIEFRKISKKAIPQSMDQMQSLLGKQPYLALSPLIVNIRNCDPSGANIRGIRMVHNDETSCFKVFLSEKHILWVVDGQHRRKAMQLVFDFLEHARENRDYPKKNNLLNIASGIDVEYNEEHLQIWTECFSIARQYCMVTTEVHLGLSPEQERQLFHDLNRLGKKIDVSLALQFDNSNPVNLFIKETLVDTMGMNVVEKDTTNWSNDDGSISRKDLVAINAILFLNKTNINGASSLIVNQRTDLCKRFWESVCAIPHFGEPNSKTNTVAAQPVVIKALAKLLHTFAFGRSSADFGSEIVDTFLNSISDIDFSHDNPMWRYYELSPAERELHGLTGLDEYIPASDKGANRDLGAYQSGVMRFGAKHNDIFPILGDMIRWTLKLPPRK